MKKIFIILLNVYSLAVLANWTALSTGIDDSFSGIVFKSTKGFLSGHKGLYYTTTGGTTPDSWTRFNILNNKTDSLLYNQTEFYHCYAKPSTVLDTVYACGVHKVSGTSIIVRIALSSMTLKILYRGKSAGGLKNIGYHASSNTYYAVGEHGAVVSFKSQIAVKLELNIDYDLSSIVFKDNTVCLTGKNITLLGLVTNGILSLEKRPFLANFSDAAFGSDGKVYAVGEGYYNVTKNVETYSDYYGGALNARCLRSQGSYNFIGTDHGIFRGIQGRSIVEWQPTSVGYKINEIGAESENTLNMYACGDHGIVLVTNAIGGHVMPYARLTSKGGCSYETVILSRTIGSFTSCYWFVNNKYVSNEKFDVWHRFAEAGTYSIKLVFYNESYVDSVQQVVHIVNRPKIRKAIVQTPFICKKGPAEISIDSSEANVNYTLRRYDNSLSYGTSAVGNGLKISFRSDTLDNDAYHYLQAKSSLAECYTNFKDTLGIDIEETNAKVHVGGHNITLGETVRFFENSTDATHFSWKFSKNAKVQSSLMANVDNQFNVIGRDTVFLKCWSDHGCADSIKTLGPRVYQPIAEEDPCWLNINQTHNNEYSSAAGMALSKTGYFSFGYFKNISFATQAGDSMKALNREGAYLIKYNREGVLKWMVSTGSTSIEAISAAVEDSLGNIYVSGRTHGGLTDNTGKTYPIAAYDLMSYVAKLDANGKILWILKGRTTFWHPNHISIDQLNNVIIDNSLKLYQEPIHLWLNGEKTYTFSETSSKCNYNLLKLSGDGAVIWDAGINIRATNRAGIIKITTDRFNRIYVVGILEHEAVFYSAHTEEYSSLKGIANSYGGKLFLAQYSSDGQLLWRIRSNTVGPPNDSTVPQDMVTDADGNCYISGYNNCYYEAYTQIFENTDGTVTSLNAGEYFVAKVSPKGICTWMQGAKYSYYGYGLKITLLNNEVSVAGFLGPFSGNFTTCNFTSSNGVELLFRINVGDYFIAVYDTLGNIKKIYKNGENSYLGTPMGFGGLFATADGSYYLSKNYPQFDNLMYSDFGNFIENTHTSKGAVLKFKGTCGIEYKPLVTNIYENTTSLDSKLYPNPVKHSLYLDGFKDHESIWVTIVDMQERVVLKKIYDESFDVSQLSPGLYFVVLSDAQGPFHSGKIVKE